MKGNYKAQAQYNQYVIGLHDDGKIEVMVNGKPFEGSVNSILKNEIAKGLEFVIDPKWNPRTLGRKLIDYINTNVISTSKTEKVSKKTKQADAVTKAGKKILKACEPIINESIKKLSKATKKVPVESKETKQVREWCESMGLKKYEILPNNEIDAYGYVDLAGKVSGELPKYIQFNRVMYDKDENSPWWIRYSADFDITNCNLKTLRGCPRYIEGNFCAYNNKLTSLSYAPTHVGHTFICHNNSVEFTNADVKNVCDATWIRTVKTSFFDEPKKSKKQKAEE
jgi:hypothetical protein